MNRLWPAVILALLLILSASNAYSQSQQDASSSLVVMVVAPNDFTNQEYFETRKIFDKAKAKVTVASIEKGVAPSHDGARIKVDAAIRELVPNQFGAIVVIGGLGAINSLSKSESLRALLIEAYRQHKVVAAICVGCGQKEAVEKGIEEGASGNEADAESGRWRSQGQNAAYGKRPYERKSGN